jgi:hypothetical protein
MKDLLAKISSYNLFNYLFPGTVFVLFLDSFTQYSLIQQDVVTGAFLYYFIGFVISQFGSLVIEPFLKKTGFLEFAPYEDFVAMSKKDDKIELLSETNNTYRTLCSLFVLLILVKLFEKFQGLLPFLKDWETFILVIILLTLSLFCYQKRTKYIKKRIKANQMIVSNTKIQ